MRFKKINNLNIQNGVQPLLGVLAMWVTQDIVMRLFFKKKIVIGEHLLPSNNEYLILAPTHRSRWDGLMLTLALGRRVTSRDCRFMVTKSEMTGLQGWFLKRLGCFPINQELPSLFSLKYALKLIVNKQQLVIFPEGKINKIGKKLPLRQGLYRLAKLASKKVDSVKVIPIGIAYSQINPKFRGEVALCIEEPLEINDFLNSTIEEFNQVLQERMSNAEQAALNLVNR